MRPNGERRFQQVKKWLSQAESLVILGVGNPILGDDGVGPWLSSRLERSARKNVTIITAYTTPENFLGSIHKVSPSHLLVIDAAVMGSSTRDLMLGEAERGWPPGAWVFIDPKRFHELSSSTHTGSLSLLMKILRQDYPALSIKLLLIQPGTTTLYEGLSPEVLRTAEDLLTRISEALA